MRLVVHDYSGHAFPTELSRWLAKNKHDVLHLYSADIEAPRGRLDREPGDPENLKIEAVSTGSALEKYSLMKRYFQERRFAARLSHRIQQFDPDCILSGNAPIDIQKRLRIDFPELPFVFWVQDIYSIALKNLLDRKLPVIGNPISWWFSYNEFQTMRKSDAVVVITDDFRTILTNHRVNDSKITTIENWAPIQELPKLDKRNAWALEHRLEGKFVYLYSGTLGLKHNPQCLVDLARHVADLPDVAVVVVSQGLGRQMLESARASLRLQNLYLFDYQPFERIPEVLATGDVLIALLEPDASTLSVPSKVLTYLTAGKPILAMIPDDNQAARVVASSGAGVLVPADEPEYFVEAALTLYDDAARRKEMGRNARDYSERTFDIDVIGARFMEVIGQACR